MSVEELLASLRAGDLPPQARRWLIEGLEAWQQGQDLESALGLHSEPLDRRDELLRAVIEVSPGDSTTAKCAYAAECLAADRDHVSPLAADLVRKLQASAIAIPQSIRQLARILNGTRQDSETENACLCPDWPLPENSDKPMEQTACLKEKIP